MNVRKKNRELTFEDRKEKVGKKYVMEIAKHKNKRAPRSAVRDHLSINGPEGAATGSFAGLTN